MSNQGCYASHAGKSPRNSSSTVVLHSSFQPFLVGGAPGLGTKKWIWNTSTTMWCRGFAGCFRSHISHIYRSLILIYDLVFGFMSWTNHHSINSAAPGPCRPSGAYEPGQLRGGDRCWLRKNASENLPLGLAWVLHALQQSLWNNDAYFFLI